MRVDILLWINADVLVNRYINSWILCANSLVYHISPWQLYRNIGQPWHRGREVPLMHSINEEIIFVWIERCLRLTLVMWKPLAYVLKSMHFWHGSPTLDFIKGQSQGIWYFVCFWEFDYGGSSCVEPCYFPNRYLMYSSSSQIDADIYAGGHKQLQSYLRT